MPDDFERTPDVAVHAHRAAAEDRDAASKDGAPLTGRRLRARRMQVNTLREAVAYLRRDSLICRSEGFAAQTRLQLDFRDVTVVATLQTVIGDWLELDEIGLSEAALPALEVDEGEWVRVRHMAAGEGDVTPPTAPNAPTALRSGAPRMNMLAAHPLSRPSEFHRPCLYCE